MEHFLQGKPQETSLIPFPLIANYDPVFLIIKYWDITEHDRAFFVRMSYNVDLNRKCFILKNEPVRFSLL